MSAQARTAFAAGLRRTRRALRARGTAGAVAGATTACAQGWMAA